MSQHLPRPLSPRSHYHPALTTTSLSLSPRPFYQLALTTTSPLLPPRSHYHLALTTTSPFESPSDIEHRSQKMVEEQKIFYAELSTGSHFLCLDDYDFFPSFKWPNNMTLKGHDYGRKMLKYTSLPGHASFGERTRPNTWDVS